MARHTLQIRAERDSATGIGLVPVHFGSRIMKLQAQGKKQRWEYSALVPVVALLVAATFAKVSAATQLFHFAH
jgi:hypothetical protein